MANKLLVATHNSGKVKELADMLDDLEVEWLGLDDAGTSLEVSETGATFEENAVIKATNYAAVTGLLTLADDSGLEVDALDGRPGVHTARYGGPGLTQRQRYELLLRKLSDVAWEDRVARFRCVVALADRHGLIGTAAGVCEGIIALEPAGSGGFGYDPIFFLPEKGLTMAQLPAAEKHRISHRGRAISAIAPLLREALSGRES
jgi:XTP/dITP diphosphohydrolase